MYDVPRHIIQPQTYINYSYFIQGKQDNVSLKRNRIEIRQITTYPRQAAFALPFFN
jgi:hypothetical protein